MHPVALGVANRADAVLVGPVVAGSCNIHILGLSDKTVWSGESRRIGLSALSRAGGRSLRTTGSTDCLRHLVFADRTHLLSGAGSIAIAPSIGDVTVVVAGGIDLTVASFPSGKISDCVLALLVGEVLAAAGAGPVGLVAGLGAGGSLGIGLGQLMSA